jgi:tetratricopeptide (TPR) repeat protein
VQFNAQPANPREVQAGDVPSFPRISFSADDQIMFQCKPEAMKAAQLASQLEAEGRVEEAIQHCREALNVDSNNPVVLNNLAWILATAGKPELRNGGEAVQLATKAVDLTDRRLPFFIGTLAAAFAEAGQFPQAYETAHVAYALALLTGQQDVADRNARLLILYSSGKAADAAPGP